MKVDGLHHVTAITADIEANLNFYGRLLGPRLVWQAVNADDPEMRHVAYGDERASPGSIVTFFDMPGVAPGRPGSGMAIACSSGWRMRRRLISGSVGWLVRLTGWPIGSWRECSSLRSCDCPCRWWASG
jgi:Glyoxalase/Bleomycin resistance protein/Dioxygenase superfamily